MNNNYYKTITALITEFEAMSERGVLSVMNDRSYLLLIEYYIKEEIWDRAFEVIEHALNNYSYTVDFYVKKAQLLSRVGKLEEALAVIDQAQGFSPEELEIKLTRAEVYINLGQIQEAFQLLEELKGSGTPQVISHVYVLESLIHKQQNNYEPIFFTLRSALKLNTKNEQATELFWTSIEGTKRYKKAKKIFEELIDQDPYSHLFWYYYGHTLSYLGEYRAAIDAYEYSFIIEPDFEPGYKEFAELCFELKIYPRALSCCQEFLERFALDNEFLVLTGQCLQMMEQYDEARKYYHKALQLDPMDDELLYHLGQCYAQIENWKNAIWYYRKAIDIEDKREEYFAAIAEAFWACDQYQQAEAAYLEAISITPEEAYYWLHYAGFLLNTDRGEEALAVLTEAEEQAIGAEISYGKIACLFCLGRRQEGLFWLVELLMEEYEAHPVLFELFPALAEDSEVIQTIADFLQ